MLRVYYTRRGRHVYIVAAFDKNDAARTLTRWFALVPAVKDDEMTSFSFHGDSRQVVELET